jgi:hypothetical protein
MRNFVYAAKAFIVGSVLGGGYGSMMGGHILQGVSIGGAAALAVAWLVIVRESNA